MNHEWTTEDSYFLVHRAEVASRPEVIAFRKWILDELQAELPGPMQPLAAATG